MQRVLEQNRRILRTDLNGNDTSGFGEDGWLVGGYKYFDALRLLCCIGHVRFRLTSTNILFPLEYMRVPPARALTTR